MVATQNLPAILSDDQLRRATPSVFATQPLDGVSDRYRFLPTINVLDMMREQNFFPVKASQNYTRLPDRRNFCRHVVRLRHSDHLTAELNEEVPEIVLMNSHDRSSAYRIFAGLWRQICSNGLTIQSENFGSFSLRHSGSRDMKQQVIDTTFEIVSTVPAIMNTVKEWKGLQLAAPAQAALAEAAHVLRDMPNVAPAQLLTHRRKEDAPASDGSRSLWATMNVIEENMMTGGLTGKTAKGRKTKTRPIKSVSEDVRLNRSLWVLSDQLSKML